MDSIAWDNVAQEFAYDGTLRDIYVIDANLKAWQGVLDELRRARYAIVYHRDGGVSELPATAAEAFPAPEFADRLLSVRFAGVQANCHFFASDEIEFDIDPRDVCGQTQLDALFDFMHLLSDATGMEAVLTPENGPEFVIFRARPNRAEVEYHAVDDDLGESNGMELRYRLTEAIGRFNNWSQPWTFHESVAAVLDPQDAEQFERIWFAAISTSLWLADRDLGRCADHVSSALLSQFPQLNENSAQAVVNAASYLLR